MSIALLILGLVLFVLLIVVHEFGHFVVARRNGVEVEEFGIFFPPRLWKRKTKGGWDFTINALPLGGFVRLKGEHDNDTRKGSFGAAGLSTKVKIMLAGVGMNLLAAFVLFTILGWVGMPQLIDNQFTVRSDTRVIKNQILAGYIEPGSPAARAGLRSSDELKAIGMPGKSVQQITAAMTLPQITKSFAGQTVEVHYVRDKQSHQAKVTLLSQKVVANSQKTTQPKGYLGISPAQYTLQRSTWSAPLKAAGLVAQFTELTGKGLGKAVAGLGSTIAGVVTGNTQARQHGQSNATSQVGGPVAVFFILKEGTLLGYQFIIMIVALISLTLAIMNVLPIPGLDGGKLFVTLLARTFRKTLSERAEMAIYGTGYAALILLIIVITIVDVHRFF